MHSSDDRFTRFSLQMIRFGRFLYRFFEALAGTGHCGASHQVALAWHWALSASLQAGTGHCGAGYKCNTAVPSLALSATWDPTHIGFLGSNLGEMILYELI